MSPFSPLCNTGPLPLLARANISFTFLIAICGVAAGGGRRRNKGFLKAGVGTKLGVDADPACVLRRGGGNRRALEMWKALTNHISQERFTGVQSTAEGMDVRFSYTIEGLLFPRSLLAAAPMPLLVISCPSFAERRSWSRGVVPRFCLDCVFLMLSLVLSRISLCMFGVPELLWRKLSLKSPFHSAEFLTSLLKKKKKNTTKSSRLIAFACESLYLAV